MQGIGDSEKLKVLVMDVDGTLTDGKIYMGNQGEEFKVFNIHDGYAICNILPKLGIIPVILTGRASKIVENRAKELRIQYVFQDVNQKKIKLEQFLTEMHLVWENIAYIGDDIPDLECMKRVRFAICPNDAVDEVKKICCYICSKNAGSGAVREGIEWIQKQLEIQND